MYILKMSVLFTVQYEQYMNSTLVARQIPEYCATLIAAVLSQDLNPLETPELKKLWAQKKRDSLTFSSLKKTDVLYIHVHTCKYINWHPFLKSVQYVYSIKYLQVVWLFYFKCEII